ncbi:putative nucleolar GTP-binding protein 1 [Schizosaccharomyces pombe 972h-] [Rhizoctonia solani]|uniref:Nucleolar GTP-binding protein 1 n=1 Tax=Rhizoctonia solani TaxID=456999 RepID=A0A0K6FX98_9AGAM|nr:putative nucleolar GTP-binding protein 1 [Schizosaccharomyces pombe 972h-] [Rhizoctonia solani]
MATKGLKAIAPVPTANDFLDIILSKTQRKTPTVIHKNFKISRIRNFYMRKVKFTQDSFDEKLGAILSEFPILDNLHPFMSSLLNVLYDKNHYKLALGQLNTARHLISQVAKDYVRLLKFGDSLYRCKQLKRAALGRMATIMRRQKDPLAYLEQVRQHLARLPSIDPTTRTLLVCGYPNVGKSSFVNKVTRADVDVQPYAFTTKSLFVGHLDYKYLRWQVIDTPGILDHPLEEMNTIEMQSVTAMAHLRSAILYFMDLSERCGYTIEAQVKLFHSIKPLFAGKPVVVVINKIDVVRLDDLNDEQRTLVDTVITLPEVKTVQVSCYTDEGVTEVKTTACDELLAHRVESKLRGTKINTVVNRIHVAVPVKRDDKERKPFIPEVIKERRKYDKEDPERMKLEKDLEAEGGGAGVYSIDMRKNWILQDESWKYDVMPEIWEGKNVADFIDADIEAKLAALEAEEEKLEAEGFYESEEEIFDSDDEREAEELLKMQRAQLSHHSKSNLKSRPVMPRTAAHRTMSGMAKALTAAGYDPSRIEERAVILAKAARAKEAIGKRKREDDMEVDSDEGDDGDSDGMEVDEDESPKRAKTNLGTSKRVPKTDRQLAGLKNAEQAEKAIRLRNLGQRERNMHARAGESDRAIKVKMPKHLYAGKRKAGKTDRR